MQSLKHPVTPHYNVNIFEGTSTVFMISDILCKREQCDKQHSYRGSDFIQDDGRLRKMEVCCSCTMNDVIANV